MGQAALRLLSFIRGKIPATSGLWQKWSSATGLSKGSLLKGDTVGKAALAVMAVDVAGEAVDLVQDFVKENPELADVISIFDVDFKAEVSEDSIDSYADEFMLIAKAAKTVGSYERLVLLKNALEMDDSIYKKYEQVRKLGKLV